LAVLFLCILLLAVVVAVSAGSLLDLVESWRFGTGFYYALGNLLMTNESPDTALGKMIDIVISTLGVDDCWDRAGIGLFHWGCEGIGRLY